MALLITIAVLAVTVIACSCETNVTYSCSKDASDTIVFNLRITRSKDLPKLTMLNGDSCYLEFDGYSTMIKSYNNGSMGCGVTKQGEMYMANYTATSLRKCSNCISKGDVYFSMTCSSNVTSEVTATFGNVPGEMVKVTGKEMKAVVTMGVTGSDGKALDLRLPIALGTPIKLQISMKPMSGGATGVKIVNLYVTDGTKENMLNLIDKNGCAHGKYKVMQAGTGFSVTNGSSSEYVMVETKPILMFKFITGNIVKFGARVDLCYANEDCGSSCKNASMYSGRKKRSVRGKYYEVEIIVGNTNEVVGSKKPTSKTIGQDKCAPPIAPKTSNNGYIISMVVLGSVLALTLSFTLLMYFCVIRKKLRELK